MINSEAKKRVEVLKKQTDDWKNNQFTHRNGYAINHMLNMPKFFKEFERDKGKDIDAGKRLALPQKTKIKRRRQIINPALVRRL